MLEARQVKVKVRGCGMTTVVMSEVLCMKVAVGAGLAGGDTGSVLRREAARRAWMGGARANGSRIEGSAMTVLREVVGVQG